MISTSRKSGQQLQNSLRYTLEACNLGQKTASSRVMKTESIHKYRAFPAVDLPDREWPDQSITSAPVWASVDLRDGNQALPVPMSIEEKLEFFQLLCRIGFKQIEIGFPSASETDYNFVRELILNNHIPSDVTVQVLTQSRKLLIDKTIESLKGCHKAIILRSCI